MALEKIELGQDVLTPELVRNLAEKYRNIVDELQRENHEYCNLAEMIVSEEVRRKVLARLGQIAVKCAEIDEELKVSLN